MDTNKNAKENVPKLRSIGGWPPFLELEKAANTLTPEEIAFNIEKDIKLLYKRGWSIDEIAKGLSYDKEKIAIIISNIGSYGQNTME